MKFGKLESIEGITFSLPPDPPENHQVLIQAHATPKFYAGAPKWATKQWAGKVYPKGTKDRDFLEVYASRFNTIELNTTFYNIPSEETVLKWKHSVNEDFKFCPKIYQFISHHARMKGKAFDATDEFCDRMSMLEYNLGTMFLQLPSNYTTNHLPHLLEYLEVFPLKEKLAIEFRHPSWFVDDAKSFRETCDQLAKWKIGTVITDVAGRQDVLHTRLTNTTAFIRFVGNDLHPTDWERTDLWLERLKSWWDHGITEVYFFPHQPDNILVPEYTHDLKPLIYKTLGVDIPDPLPHTSTSQASLF